MSRFHSRLFARIISRNREVYLLKIITLAIAFACSTLIILFSLNEFGYDRFHDNAGSVFRIIQRNTSETFSGNRLSSRIPFDVFAKFRIGLRDSAIVSRVKVMDELTVVTDNRNFHYQKIHAADAEISAVFSFDIVNGALTRFVDEEQTALLSSSAARHYFGSTQVSGRKIKIYSLGDTVEFTIAAVYQDYPQNSHEVFNTFIRFDSLAIHTLRFNPMEAGVYGRMLNRNKPRYEVSRSHPSGVNDLIYKFQPVPEIYFGPRVTGEDAVHGDHYSVLILICITCLILFLALTSFVNLTTLTLPHRSKELAVKKLAGTSHLNLLAGFARESFLIVGISLILGVSLLLITSDWIQPILSINLIALLLDGNVWLFMILLILYLILGAAPLFMTYKFTRATPNRLLSTDTITFPHFKKVITVLQLGISIFLIVASGVIKRQVNYSLLKEPGRNHDQVVYLSYPENMTNESLFNLRAGWRKNNPNIVDVMATSQLPDRITSKELNSEFYAMSVDPAFLDFFSLQMVQGNWFRANDGDSIMVVNEKGKELLGDNTNNLIGVVRDMSGQFNQPEKPLKINIAPYFNYNYLCIRVLEVDIRKTLDYLSRYFELTQPGSLSFMNKRFEQWLLYQDRLNALSSALAIISGLLSCCAIYGLSVSLVRDKLKQR